MSKIIIAVALAVTALVSTGLLVHQLTKTHNENPHGPVTFKQTVPSHVYDAWTHWKREHKKSYGGAEQEQAKLLVFHENFKKVEAHYNKPNKTYEKSLNQFADLTSQEFKALYLQTHVPLRQSETSQFLVNEVADTVDWRKKNVVTDIKDQGMCGSCWAFSTTGSIESALAIKNKKQVTLSEQQLVDCSGSYGNQGCNGGLMDDGFGFVKDNGITTEDKYPYKGVDQSCSQKSGEYKIKSWVDVPQGDVDQLAAAVNIQPVSIAVDAEEWQFYSSGVFSDCGTSLDHGVLLVGYDADAWYVKNSWASSWGEKGYIRLARGNTCGLANMASYPVV